MNLQVGISVKSMCGELNCGVLVDSVNLVKVTAESK